MSKVNAPTRGRVAFEKKMPFPLFSEEKHMHTSFLFLNEGYAVIPFQPQELFLSMALCNKPNCRENEKSVQEAERDHCYPHLHHHKKYHSHVSSVSSIFFFNSSIDIYPWHGAVQRRIQTNHSIASATHDAIFANCQTRDTA